MAALRSLSHRYQQDPHAIAAGWRHPSWPTLLLASIVAGVLGAVGVPIVLYFTVFAWIVSAFAAGLWVCLRQRAGEGALLVMVAVTVGGVMGTELGVLLWQREPVPFVWSDVVTAAVLFALLGLTVAPCVIRESQRRFMTRHRVAA